MQKSSNRLIWLFVAGSLCVDAVTPWLIDVIVKGPANWLAVILAMGLVGVVAGQVCFVVVLATLSRPTWFGGFLLGTLLITVGGCLIGIGLLLLEESPDEAVLGFATLGLIPGFLLAAAGPLYLFRRFAGWRLDHAGADRTPWQPLGLEGAFSFITVLAAAMVLLRVPQVIWEVEPTDYWPVALIMSAGLFAVGLVVLPWYVRFGMGKEDAAPSVPVLVGLSVAVMVLLFGVTQLFYSWQATWNERLEGIPFIFALVTGASGVFCFSLWLLRGSGLTLIRQPKQASPSEEQQVALRRQRRMTRWQIAAAIVVTMAVNVGLARLQSWREMKDLQHVGLRQFAEVTGGGITIRNHRVFDLELGTRAGAQGLVSYRTCSQLQALHLNGMPITDAGLAELQHFPRLSTLVLEHTQVTDAGLVHLQYLRRLESLALAGEFLTGSGLVHVADDLLLAKLFLSGTKFSDEESALLESFRNLRELDVSSTQITDQCLQRLGALPHLNNLSANATSITARNFPPLPQLGVLSLDDTQVDDESIASFGRLPLLWNLSLRNAKITNAALPGLSKSQGLLTIDLSGNDIDDDGVRELRTIPRLRALHLNDTRVTGSAFADWAASASLTRLSLDRTLIDDQGVKHLAKLKIFQSLSLRGTKITDACLVDIATMGIDTLDLSETQVTVKGIRANGMRNVGELTLSEMQLQGIDLQLFEKQLGIEVELQEPDKN